MSINDDDLFDDFETQEFNGILIIGDTHFRSKHLSEGEAFVQRVLEIAIQKSPTAIVLLGDILDTHETAKVQPFKLACRFIEDLSGIAPTYVLMGNHDLMNQSQFCTDNHFFNPLKKWENVFIVDVPQVAFIGDHKVVLCPYVPPGRFVEALELLDDNFRTADCIFAHQEFKGADMSSGDGGTKVPASSKGDDWDRSFPPVISGHIHKPHVLNGNIFYLGSAMQIAFDEEPNKCLNILRFNDATTSLSSDNFEKISLGLKGKITLNYSFEELREFDESLADTYYLKLKITGEQQQFRHFKTSELYKSLVNKGVKITFELNDSRTVDASVTKRTTPLTFRQALKEMVRDSNEKVQNAYKEVFEEDPEEPSENEDPEEDPEEDPDESSPSKGGYSSTAGEGEEEGGDEEEDEDEYEEDEDYEEN
jgi:UDP-2,3-diacylglucosamine pyrophosphatase LpxH